MTTTMSVAGAGSLDRLGLVGVGPLDAAPGQPGDDARIEPRREVDVLGGPGRQDRVVDDPPRERWLGQQLGQDGTGFGGGICSHAVASERTDVRNSASLAEPVERCDRSSVTARRVDTALSRDYPRRDGSPAVTDADR